MKSKKKNDDLWVILFGILVIACLFVGASYSSNQADQSLKELAPQYKPMTFWHYLSFYPAFMLAVIAVLGIIILARKKSKAKFKEWRRRRLSRRIDQSLQRSQAYLPGFRNKK
ncbi:MAG: hypothetical protein Q7R92_00390 [bacterium]|nr:hypothetical protein [bacterium]